MDHAHLQPLLKSFGLESKTVRPLSGGLINQTYAVGDDHVLQGLHPVFAGEVNDDIFALLPHLKAGGCPVPELVQTTDGRTFETDADGRPWRVLTRLRGKTVHVVENAGQAEAAAVGLARFHNALIDVEHTFVFSRPDAHNTHKHLMWLRRTVNKNRSHRLHRDVEDVGIKIFQSFQLYGVLPPVPTLICHGDPKISNFLFTDDEQLAGIVDLDTMGVLPLDVELGDAMRSWCNTSSEDDTHVDIDLNTCATLIKSYRNAAAPKLRDMNWELVARGGERIALELAARFATDAIREEYFGWDASRYASRGEHNLVRARNQLALARAFQANREMIELFAS